MKDILTKILLIVVLLAVFEAGSIFYIIKTKNAQSQLNENNKSTGLTVVRKLMNATESARHNVINQKEILKSIGDDKQVVIGEVGSITDSEIILRTNNQNIKISYELNKTPFGTRSLVVTNNMKPISDQSGIYIQPNSIKVGDIVEVYGAYDQKQNILIPKIIILTY